MNFFDLFFIDFASLQRNFVAFFTEQPPFDVIIDLLGMFGWLVPFTLFTYLVIFYLRGYKEDKYTANWQWVVLAIDIPPENVQTPLAVEQLFSHLAGAFDSPNIAAAFRHGFKQHWFSFEIVSIGGYIQFIVRTEQTFRELVEAAVYAQYPDAEIVEVEDYVDASPDTFPNDTHEMWAADFGLAEHFAYPIRTYRAFEHSISKDTVLKDPMGTFLESFSRIGQGEQIWFQIVVEPSSNSWKEKVIDKVKEMIGDTSAGQGKRNKLVDAVGDAPITTLETIGDMVFAREASAGGADRDKKEAPNKLQYLTPGQSKLVEAMEEKMSKIGFKTKIRAVYLARKEVFRPERAVNALIGAVNQFNIVSANSIVLTFGVSTSYFRKDKRTAYRKNLLMQAYKKRKISPGAPSFYLNIEELATIWHFPMSHVKTPLIQKAIGKRAEPPSGLPVEGLPSENTPEEKGLVPKTDEYITDSGHVAYDGDIRFG